jgi:NAD(P)-dependent dehydrogenase (short-subunit alcohol dehydrogenase family)
MGSRSLEKAKSAIETLKEDCPAASNTVEAVQLDLTSDQSIENAFKQVETNQGRLDVLINNAGMCSYCDAFCPPLN